MRGTDRDCLTVAAETVVWAFCGIGLADGAGTAVESAATEGCILRGLLFPFWARFAGELRWF